MDLRQLPVAIGTTESASPTPSANRHLDLGCGVIPRNPYGRTNLCGIDIQLQSTAENIEFRVANLTLESIPYADDTFASVSAFDFIEHVPRILGTADGLGTRFPFIELMNEVWRVLAPGGRFYALTPAYPHAEAFQDPTHVNIITERTHEYFCGNQPLGRMYGFHGSFELLRSRWAMLPEEISATHQLLWHQSYRRWRRLRRGKLSHLVWEFVAVKSARSSPA